MTKGDLIFDWKRSESRGRDRLFAFVVVALSLLAFAGVVDVSLPAFRNAPAEAAELIRFADKGMARSWLLEAEENGPFPGRLHVDGGVEPANIFDGRSLDAWSDYRQILRPLSEDATVGRGQITPKGKRVFPAIPAVLRNEVADVSPPGEMRRMPILNPFDRAALEWMPDDLPDITLPAGAEIASDSLRFAISLREDGSVAEAIPLGGGDDDSAQRALEGWLRGLRFKKGEGERWFGLRVEFVNRRENDAQPE